jgi:four helix bundle protein
MTTARSHTDLICWQRANEVKRLVYVLIRSTTARRDFEFRKQLREAASAVPRLIAEGFGRYIPPNSRVTCGLATVSWLKQSNR